MGKSGKVAQSLSSITHPWQATNAIDYSTRQHNAVIFTTTFLSPFWSHGVRSDPTLLSSGAGIEGGAALTREEEGVAGWGSGVLVTMGPSNPFLQVFELIEFLHCLL